MRNLSVTFCCTGVPACGHQPDEDLDLLEILSFIQFSFGVFIEQQLVMVSQKQCPEVFPQLLKNKQNNNTSPPKPCTSLPSPTYNLLAVIFSSFLLDLNILDWNLENLIAVAVGPAAHILNGRTLQGIESIGLNSCSKYISSLAWIKEGTCLAVGTSDGEVQVLNNLLFQSFLHFQLKYPQDNMYFFFF